ncbi:ribosomal protection-like ABC-F family protein [Thomasclavelia spiroformis]|uniref:ribosomal protection-like ABC-F family protein n=1 Tax=Thomasclavelia spiroformis TaxID=29348 RepID=UPI001D25D341|nr:ABC-F type ribosomal protection protein [Thomasclavelia spiroformis]MBS7217479.1 ABC-F type ribosomal protection protein [Thomasclavelia spiroformis]
MGLLEVKNLTFGYDNQIENVFDNISFKIDTNWKLGLIGRNGKGKTTLLNLFCGNYDYQGEITQNYLFDYFPFLIQDENLKTIDIIDNILDDYQLWEVERELSLLDVDLIVLDQMFSTLSKGEQTKVLLAVLFLKPHDIVLIDEPTNHLDYHGRKILSNYLRKKQGFILVSHDRNFLDSCIDHVLVINRTSIEVIKGNFSLWYELKNNQDELEIQKNKHLKKDIKRLKTAAKQNENWSHKVEATKSARVSGEKGDRGFIGHKAAKMMQRSKNVERRINRAIEEKSGLLKNVETVEKLKIAPLVYSKKCLCYLENIKIIYDNRAIVENVSFSINRHERINLVGKNGSGKSSIIKLIMGGNIEYEGKINIGSNLKIAYLSQDDSNLSGSLDDYARDNDLDLSLFKTILRKIDFSRELFLQDISTYSKGQKKKVMLAGVLCQSAHLYILDEPLNYLDIFTRMQIQELLLSFDATVLFVEHDQYFCDNVATKKVLI